jgi:hypothetical protein
MTAFVPRDNISRLKWSKYKAVFAFFDRYCICFDIKQTSWLLRESDKTCASWLFLWGQDIRFAWRGFSSLCYHLWFGNWEGFSVSLRLINSLSQTVYVIWEKPHQKLQSDIKSAKRNNDSRGSVTTKTQARLKVTHPVYSYHIYPHDIVNHDYNFHSKRISASTWL